VSKYKFFTFDSVVKVNGYRLGRVKGTIENVRTGMVYATAPTSEPGRKAWAFLIEREV